MTGRDRILKETLAAYKKHNYSGILILPTGVGKGRIMIEICKLLNVKTILYLCNSVELRDKTFIDELHKWDAAHLLPKIELQCYQSSRKWVGKHYDLVLADEFDAALTPEYVKVFNNNTFTYKILVSATLDDDKKRIAKKIAPIIYEKTQKEVIADKVLNKIHFYFINYDLSPTENYEYLTYNGRFKTLLNQTQTKGTAFQLERLKIARKQFLSCLFTSVQVTKWLLSTLKPRNEKVLIFCGLSKQADKVCANSYHSVNNNVEALQMFESGVIKELAVVDKLTRGVNITDVRNIVHESAGSSKTRMVQRTGRGLRLAVDEILNVFFLIPHYKHPFYGKKPTIVMDWIIKSTKDMDMSNVKVIEYKAA